jgi:hypothetical protein
MIRRFFARLKNRRELAAVAKQLEAENAELRADLTIARDALRQFADAATHAASGAVINIMVHKGGV